MITIAEIIIAIIMLFICICVVYHYFIKQLNELETRILVLEKRIGDYKIENYKLYNDLNNTINVLIEYKKLKKKVKNK